MFLVGKDNKSIINTDRITSMYIGADGCTVKVDFENGKGCQVGRYNSEREAQAAIEIVSGNVGRLAVCGMPDDDAVSARISQKNQKQHHATGKKTKGHGGS